jgi:uncharacterized membrane protein YjjB (DUF3815 family)
MTPWWIEPCAAPVAVGFAMVFNVPPRFLPLCAVLGVLGHGTRWSVVQLGGGAVMGTLCGAMLIALVAHVVSLRLRQPPTLVTIAGVIPLIPGTVLYQAVTGIIQLGLAPAGQELQDMTTATIGHAAHAALVMLALVLGLTAPALLPAPRAAHGHP